MKTPYRDRIRYGLAIMVLLSALGGTILSHARGSARTSQRAFVSWARQAAIPVPASPEEPMSDEARSALGRMLAGTGAIYLCGAGYLAALLGLHLRQAVTAGVVPFLIGDGLKLVAAAAFCRSYRERLRALFP